MAVFEPEIEDNEQEDEIGASISLRTTVPWDISSRLTILNMVDLQDKALRE
jgi:hypothetical protein